MKVSKTLWDSWKLKKEHKDIKLISEESGLHRNTISNGLKYGDMTKETFAAIKKYFANKKEATLK